MTCSIFRKWNSKILNSPAKNSIFEIFFGMLRWRLRPYSLNGNSPLKSKRELGRSAFCEILPNSEEHCSISSPMPRNSRLPEDPSFVKRSKLRNGKASAFGIRASVSEKTTSEKSSKNLDKEKMSSLVKPSEAASASPLPKKS